MVVWFAVAMVFRRRFQFSLRSLLVLVVVVALPCSWLAVEMRQARLQKEAVDMVVSLGGSVFHDERRTFDANSGMLPNATTPEWLWNLLGEDFFAAAFQIFPFTMSYQAWEPVEDEARLKALWLSYTTVTDAKLEYLKVFPQLRETLSRRHHDFGHGTATCQGIDSTPGVVDQRDSGYKCWARATYSPEPTQEPAPVGHRSYQGRRGTTQTNATEVRDRRSSMGMIAAVPHNRRLHFTPGRFVIGLLAVEVLLWLSERFGWLGGTRATRC